MIYRINRSQPQDKANTELIWSPIKTGFYKLSNPSVKRDLKSLKKIKPAGFLASKEAGEKKFSTGSMAGNLRETKTCHKNAKRCLSANSCGMEDE